jgi:hypothetical protein
MDGIARTDADERRELFTEAAAQRGDISPEVIEKDFWVCWTLKHVFGLGPAPAKLIFKGGTSLSKVYGVIERFSEDIDLSLSREDLGFTGERDPYQATSGKKQAKLIDELVSRCKAAIAGELLPKLRERFATVLGGENSGESPWSLSIDETDAQTVNFSYPPGIASGGALPPSYVRPIVRLELGARSDHWPAEEHVIRSYAAEIFPDSFEEPTCRVRTLSAERTFWEKVTILHAESHRPKDKPSGERLSRHYYDVAKLYQNDIGPKALARTDLLEAVVTHKRLFFSSGWANYATAVPGSLRLVPPEERRASLEADYRVMRETMIFGESYSFDELLAVLGEVERVLNQVAG